MSLCNNLTLVRENTCGHAVCQKDKPRGLGGARAAGPWVPDGGRSASPASAKGATKGFGGGIGLGSWDEGPGPGMLSFPSLAVGDLFSTEKWFYAEKCSNRL